MASGECNCNESIALRARLDLTTRAYAECTEQRHALQDRLFECDETDSAALHEMRAVIDDFKLWRDEAQEEAGDYQSRMIEIAAELKAPDAALKRALLRRAEDDATAAIIKAERDYMLAHLDASEVIQMRKHLAAEWEAQHLGALPVDQQSDFDEVEP